MDTTAPGSDQSDISATASQASEQLKTALNTADSTATQSIQTLGSVHQARLSRATRTAAALKTQYGADDPRVKAAEASVTATQTTIARVSAVQRELTVPVVQVSTTGWALQGYVVDTQYQPQTRFTVYLADANHLFVRQYGFSYTDDNGYFLINYTGDPQQQQSTQTQTGAQTPQLFIGVVDQDRNPVFLSSTPFQPLLGSAAFQIITVPAGGQTLGDPTQPIRNVAFPGKDVRPKSQSNPASDTTTTTDAPKTTNTPKQK
jgi:hypothetical protein